MLKFILITILFLSGIANAQSILDEFSEQNSDAINYELVTEKIINVSLSKRIFLITNSNDSFSRGDFVTFLLDKKPITRGLVAKLNGEISAIKITKIYSLPLFNSLTKAMTIQVIRGDDSFYRLKKSEDAKEEFTIESEEDLYDDTNIDDYGGAEKESKSVIKNDNVVYAGVGVVAGYDQKGNENTANQMQGAWMYQFKSDIWIEGLFGQHLLKGYPDPKVDTQVRNFQVRLKYALKGPLYTIFLPYAGFRMVDVYSPRAGETGDTTQKALELERVENLKDSGIIFGVTMLKRLVPGWFIKVEAGIDGFAGGLALEF